MFEPKELERFEMGDKGRHYGHPEDGRALPSVTNINGVLPKPWLAAWAAKVERELVMKTAARVYMEMKDEGTAISRAQFLNRLKEALPKKKAHATIRDDAADEGTGSHNVVEWRINNMLGLLQKPEPQVEGDILHGVNAWSRWADKVNFKPSHAEKRLYSDDLNAAGTTDAIACEMDVFMLGMRPRRIEALADWKRTTAIRWEAEIQIAALRHMAIERGFLSEKAWGVIVRIPKTAKEPEVEEWYIPPSRCRKLVDVFRASRVIWEHFNNDKERPR